MAPILQYVHRPGILDLGWGHPSPALLPGEDWLDATRTTLHRYGWEAMTYGNPAGPGPLIDWLAEHGGSVPSEVFVTAGASHALALVIEVLVQPGDIVVVDSPTYHLAFRTILDRGAEIVGVPTDGVELDPVATAQLIDELRRSGRRVPMLYIVPTFGNPTGRSLSDERRIELVDLASRFGLTIVEDDTYRELVYEGAAPSSLWSRSGGRHVIRLGSFSKTVAPGLRLGWINAAPAFIQLLSRLGYVDSGGGVNHTVALTMATFAESGAYGAHTSAIRRQYAAQRDNLVTALRQSAPDLAISAPAGGWFLWVRLPGGMTASALLPVAERAGVSFVAGTRFFANGIDGQDHIRLSFSQLTPTDLTEAAKRLGRALAPAGPR